MWSITLKLMRKTKRMLIPAGIAIMIGTAFIASTFLFGNAMNDSLTRQLTAMFGNANYAASINSSDLSDKELNEAYSSTVGDFHLDQIAGIEGVGGVRASVETGVSVSKGDSTVSGEIISTAAQKNMLPVNITEGDQPKDSNEVALPEDMAKQLNVGVGDTVSLTSRYAVGDDGKAKADNVRVVGLTSDPNGAYSYYGGAIVGSNNLLAAMQGVDDFNATGTTMVYLDLALDGNSVSAKTINGVKALLPKHFDLMSRQQISDESIKSLSGNQTNIVTTFLRRACHVRGGSGDRQHVPSARGATPPHTRLATHHRRKERPTVWFRAVRSGGARLRRIRAWRGAWKPAHVGHVRQRHHAGGRFNFSWQAAVVPILFGIVVTVLASMGSARSATAVTPLEALRPIELTDNRRSSLTRAIIGILMVAVGIAMAIFSIWQVQATNGGEDASGDQFTMILLIAIAGAALVFLGMVVTAVFWMPTLMKGVGALASLTGPSATVAHANIQKNPRRIAATGAALLIGVTLVSTIATGAASAKETMNGALATRYSVDIVAMGDDISQQMVKDVADINGVSDTLYAPAVSVTLEKADGTQPTSALLVGVKNIDQVKQVMRANLGNASIDSDSVLMPTYNAQTGKELQFANGTADFSTEWNQNGDATRSLTLQANQADYRRVSAQYGAVGFVDESHFTNGDLDAATHVLLVKADTDKSGVSVDDIYNDMQAALEKSTDATVTGPIAERIVWANMIDSMMMLLVGLIAVAVLIALVGVANTLSLSVIERTRESATLRAIGMTRGQLRRSLAVEALLISLVSGISGVLLGTLFGWLGAYVVFSMYGKVVFPFEWGINGIVLAVAAVAALLASVFPARRAVSTPPVEALAEA
jgi:putative ABC transport system permease protein